MLLHLDFQSDTPIYQQIRNQIVLGIADGQILPGEKLPTIRALAEECGINMMTVSKAYQLLKQEGYLHTDRRFGATICPLDNSRQVSPDTLAGLKLCFSELHLAGLNKADILKLCETLCEEESL